MIVTGIWDTRCGAVQTAAETKAALGLRGVVKTEAAALVHIRSSIYGPAVQPFELPLLSSSTYIE